MTRKQQDLASWALAVAVLISQVVLSLLGKPTTPALIAAGVTMLGLPKARRIQDAVNEEEDEDEAEEVKPPKRRPVKGKRPGVET